MGAMPRLTLYNYWRSSASHRVRIALALKGLEYEYVAVNLTTEEHSAEAHRRRSPTGYVPCLAIDGSNYTESVAIIELLEERFPSPPLYPSDAHGRARVRTLVEIVNSGIQPLQNRNVLKFLGGDENVQRTWVHHFIARGLEAIESQMTVHEREGVRGRLAYGDSPTAADVLLVPQVVSAHRFGVDIASFRRIAAGFDNAMKIEAFQRAAPDRQPDAPAA
jgi:maleylacetoacetate isomerase